MIVVLYATSFICIIILKAQFTIYYIRPIFLYPVLSRWAWHTFITFGAFIFIVTSTIHTTLGHFPVTVYISYDICQTDYFIRLFYLSSSPIVPVLKALPTSFVAPPPTSCLFCNIRI